MPEPIYVSEVIEKAMNPTFRLFELNIYGPWVTRRDQLTVKFWFKTESMDEYRLLSEVQMCLRLLQYVGKSVRDYKLQRLVDVELIGCSSKTSTIRSHPIA